MGKLKNLLLFSLFVVTLGLSASVPQLDFLNEQERQWLEKHPTIRFAGDPNYLPFEGYNKEGEYIGVVANYLSFIEQKLGISIEHLKATSWLDTLKKMRSGEVDMITNYPHQTTDGAIGTHPFMKSPIVIVAQKDYDAFISDLNQLEGKKIGLIQDYAFTEPIIRKYKHLHFVNYETMSDLYMAVAIGEVDVALSSLKLAAYQIAAQGLQNLHIVGRSDYYMELGFEIKKEFEIFVGIVNKVLDSMTPSEHNTMKKEWVDLQIETKPLNYSILLSLLLLGALVPFVMFLWNRQLKLQVEKKTFELSRLIRFFDENVISSRTDLDGSITDASSAFCRISGNTKEYLMGKNHRISKHPANDPKIYEDMWQTISEGKVWKGRVINKKRDGGYYWVDSTIEPEYDTSGKKIGYISIRHDVTAEVELQKLTDNLENIIEQRTHELSLLSSQNEAIFESANLGILLLKDRVVLRANSALCKMLNMSLDEIIGKSTRMWYENEEDFEEVGEMYELVKEGKTATWEKLFRKKGDGTFWVRVYMRAINKNNISEGVVATLEDITLEKERFLEIEKAKKAAEEATKTKSAFLANMSHEIRTPMNAIIGMTHLALLSALDAKQKNYLQKIDTAAKNLLNIINDILDFSKIESGKMSFEEIDFNLEDVLENVSNLNILKIQNKGLELLFDMDATLPTMLVGDPLRLEQILTNLVSNAVKFTDRGEIKIKIKLVEKDKERCELEISVIDTGIGLTEEQIQRLFRAFSQADSSTTREYGGTGLGLTISKYLIEQMDGKIWVESEFAKGSSFIFRVKLKLQEMQKDFLKPKERKHFPRVLVVDDNEAAREILESMLSSLKFEVATASGAEEALEMLHAAQKEAKPFELALIDWMMPKIDGIETIEMIRKDNALHSLPAFMMMTVYDKDELMQKADGLKVSSFISKPTTPSTLFDAIVNSANILAAPKADTYTISAKEDAQTKLKGAYILLVEDNPLNQEFAIEVLEKAGILVDIANNGKEAYEMAKSTSYDGILMDCQMPVMDGYEATRLIRESSAYSKVPILALSANAMESDRKLSLESGMNDHISKPIDARVLFETMSRWIQPKYKPSSAITQQSQKVSQDIAFKIDGLDLKNALERAGGDVAFLKKMLKRFAQTQDAWIEEIDKLLAQERIEDARRETHTLKGLAGNIGALNLFNITKEIEEKLKAAQIKEAELIIPSAKEELRETIKKIKQFFEVQDSFEEKEQTHHKLSRAEIENLKHDIKELISLLDEFDSQAVDVAQRVAPQLVDMDLDKEAQDLISSIENYEFEVAKEILLACKI